MARARKADPAHDRAIRDAWYKRNRERILAESRQWFEQHGKRAQQSASDGGKTPKQKQSEYNKRYAQQNKDRIKERRRHREANNRPAVRKAKADKYATDPFYWIAVRLRARLREALKSRGIRKNNRTMELIGCTTEHLRQHLERQFRDGMTWENRGYRGWHIDHIIPCAAFDLSNPDHQRQCFHWTNLQPLWEADNKSKGAKIPDGHQPQLPI